MQQLFYNKGLHLRIIKDQWMSYGKIIQQIFHKLHSMASSTHKRALQFPSTLVNNDIWCVLKNPRTFLSIVEASTNYDLSSRIFLFFFFLFYFLSLSNSRCWANRNYSQIYFYFNIEFVLLNVVKSIHLSLSFLFCSQMCVWFTLLRKRYCENLWKLIAI